LGSSSLAKDTQGRANTSARLSSWDASLARFKIFGRSKFPGPELPIRSFTQLAAYSFTNNLPAVTPFDELQCFAARHRQFISPVVLAKLHGGFVAVGLDFEGV